VTLLLAVGGDDDDFAQIAVEEVYDQGEPDQEETEAAELPDSAQVPPAAQAAQKPRKKVGCLVCWTVDVVCS